MERVEVACTHRWHAANILQEERPDVGLAAKTHQHWQLFAKQIPGCLHNRACVRHKSCSFVLQVVPSKDL